MQRLPLVLAVLVLVLVSPLLQAGESPRPLLGFSSEEAAAQRDLEKRLDQELDAHDLQEWMKKMTSHPHHLGSAQGKANAEMMAGLFRSWGYETRIETFQVLFPTPKARRLELIEPARYEAKLVEPPLAGDETSVQQDEQLPTYNAYSADGDVTGELVYVNFGVPDDYDELALRGVDVAGKIVIARYGGSFRGIKPKVAAEHGAVGCIIYSDPQGDGYSQGDVYGDGGGWRGPSSVQRGSVMDFTRYDGDALTPMVGAVADAERLPMDKVEAITKIPTLPISYEDAQPLLAALGGHVAPEGWRGALPITYHLGPGPAKVHLAVESNWDLVEARDVIAVLPGSEEPDQWVIRGNHHDGWVYGAMDPVSGMVAVLEEARAVAELAKSGWRPRRTLVYAAWDGEEPGLIGSTEWAETHAAELREKAVAYVNSDSNSRGVYWAGGSHTLEKMVNQVMREVTDPETGASLYERARASAIQFGAPEAVTEIRSREDLRLHSLGSGSDFSPFLHFLGISSLEAAFGGEEEYGQYHSIYDSFDHYVKYCDPGFLYGVALARANGRLMLRLANAPILPFEFSAFAGSASKWIDELAELPGKMRKESEEKNRRIEEGTFRLAFDPTKTWVVPEPDGPVPFLNFAPLMNASARLRKSAEAYRKAFAGVESGERTLSDDTRRALNRVLMKAERALTRDEGLPGRPWYRHEVYAPGVYTGYAPKTMPGVREAIELRRWQEAEDQIAVLGQTLESFAAEIERATEVLSKPTAPTARPGSR